MIAAGERIQNYSLHIFSSNAYMDIQLITIGIQQLYLLGWHVWLS